MARAGRQMKLLEIITEHEVDTQEELVTRLLEAGFKVTQATISRDIKDLNVIKTLSDDGKRYKYIAQLQKEPPNNDSDKFYKLFKNTVISVKSSGNIIVLKTETGSAGPAAAFLDKLDYEEILGVIAGDDTIFVVVDGESLTESVADKLANLLD